MFKQILLIILTPLSLQASSLTQEARKRAIPAFSLLFHARSSYRGKPISELQHALQTAYHAQQEEGSDELIIACLFHRIGLCIPDRYMHGFDTRFHERIGADYLGILDFSKSVCKLVKSQMNATRYVCTVEPAYYKTLSAARKKALAFRGGRMCQREQRQFECNPLFKEIMLLRQCEELADDPNLIAPPLEDYEDMVVGHLYTQLLQKSTGSPYPFLLN